LPGTGFYERVRQELGVKQNWIDSSDLSTMYKATYGPEVYRRVHRLVHHEFRARKSAAALAAIARAPWEVRPSDARRAASWLYNTAALAVARKQVLKLREDPS
jgi:anaerobic magnesium-protoporphyrin IX monomethyl ester cyclase